MSSSGVSIDSVHPVAVWAGGKSAGARRWPPSRSKANGGREGGRAGTVAHTAMWRLPRHMTEIALVAIQGNPRIEHLGKVDSRPLRHGQIDAVVVAEDFRQAVGPIP